jgi:hypothetical protein
MSSRVGVSVTTGGEGTTIDVAEAQGSGDVAGTREGAGGAGAGVGA